jgi:hypothetical protein
LCESLPVASERRNPNRTNNMNSITIYTSESGTRSENVEHSDAASHVAAGGSYSTESEVLLAFIESDEVPSSIKDGDGDTWKLVDQGAKGGEDFYTYELA